MEKEWSADIEDAGSHDNSDGPKPKLSNQACLDTDGENDSQPEASENEADSDSEHTTRTNSSKRAPTKQKKVAPTSGSVTQEQALEASTLYASCMACYVNTCAISESELLAWPP